LINKSTTISYRYDISGLLCISIAAIIADLLLFAKLNEMGDLLFIK